MNLGNCIEIKNKIAIIDLTDGVRQVSFNELNDMCDGIARGLSKYKIGDHVAVISENNIELIAYLYGSMRAGLIPVLINPNLPKSQIEYILQDSDAKCILRKEDFNSIINYGEYESVDANENDNALCLYTSGTTGNPKGVMHTHGSRYWILKKHSASMVTNRSAILTPIQYASALSNIQLSLFSGNSFVLFPKFSPKVVIPAIEKYNITTISAVTPLMNMILNEKVLLERTNLQSVRTIRLGASITKESTIVEAKKHFHNASIFLFYGITEIGPSLFGSHPTMKTPMMSVGYPIPEIQYRLVDGVLQIKTPTMFAGYKNKSDYLTEDGFYDTRDLFTIDENGFYYCHGRADDCFKSGGNMIVPQEIEKTIECHESILTCAVVPVDDAIKIFKPVCFYVGSASPDDLREFLKDKIETYKLPREFWNIEEMPVTHGGKIDRKTLIDNARKLWNQKQ